MKERVCAVVVTYEPEKARLDGLLNALRGSVGSVVVVDNGSTAFDLDTLADVSSGITLRRLGTNLGLAAGQNRGIEEARALAASHVLLMDQDSIPEDGMVTRLIEAMHQAERLGLKIACLGPRIRLPGSNELVDFPQLRWRGSGFRAHGLVECEFLMASGTLIPLSVIDEVGSMEERLFIDLVDEEWCLRARASGYRIFGADGAVLGHSLGDSSRRTWAGRWRYLPRHKPFRYYYIFRNTILVLRRNYVSIRWAAFRVALLTKLLVAHGLLTRNRRGELPLMLRGIADGFRGVTGKLSADAERTASH